MILFVINDILCITVPIDIYSQCRYNDMVLAGIEGDWWPTANDVTMKLCMVVTYGNILD